MSIRKRLEQDEVDDEYIVLSLHLSEVPDWWQEGREIEITGHADTVIIHPVPIPTCPACHQPIALRLKVRECCERKP